MTEKEQPIRIGDIITTPTDERRIVIGYTAPPDNPGRALITEKLPNAQEDYRPVIPRGWTY
ncbi:MAG: hypothetical protein AAB855_03295 [Patescibacteria group bacterium]